MINKSSLVLLPMFVLKVVQNAEGKNKFSVFALVFARHLLLLLDKLQDKMRIVGGKLALFLLRVAVEDFHCSYDSLIGFA